VAKTTGTSVAVGSGVFVATTATGIGVLVGVAVGAATVPQAASNNESPVSRPSDRLERVNRVQRIGKRMPVGFKMGKLQKRMPR
jgi:hypothetical protein